MKKLALLLTCTALVGLSLQSCNKLKEQIKANVPIKSTDITFTIPQVNNTNANSDMGSFTTTVNIDSAIKAANAELGIGNIQSAKIVSVHIELLDNDSANNFANFQSCAASFSSNTKPTMVQIASATIPNTPSSSLDLAVDNTIELKDYFSASTYNYSLTGQARTPTTHELHAKATIQFTLEVSL